MFAVTERLLLRPGWIEDAPALAAAIGDAAIARNLTRVPWPYSHQDAEQFLTLPAEPLRPRFLICLRDSNRLVGGIGLSGDIDAELGYWIARDHWGRGYATEAGRAVIALADGSLRLPRIRARRMVDNAGSANVLRKLGFQPTGKKAWSASLVRGTVETCLYAREREHSAQALAA
jgi:RimJ/RimL family protein N-acetyltransferase